MRQRSSCGSSWGRWGMNNFPHWPTRTNADLFYVKGRIGWRNLRRSDFCVSGPYLITGMHITPEGGIDWNACFHIPQKKYDESPEIAVSLGDLVITKDGTIGKVARIDWLPGPTSLNSHLFLVRPKTPDAVSTKFAYHIFRSKAFQGFIEQQKSGSTLAGLAESKFLRFQFPIPPLTEQSVVSSILDTLDTQIEKTLALIAKLEQVKEGLLHDLLTRGVDESGELRPSAEEAPELYKASPLGLIPREWDCPQLRAHIAVHGGKRLPAGHQYATSKTRFKYLRVTDLFQRRYELDELQCLHERTFRALQRYEIHAGEMFISIAGSLGFAGVHPANSEQMRTILTENAARLVPQTDCNADFVAACINSPPVQRQIDAEKGTGGGVPKLALFRIETLVLPWPPLVEQNVIAYRIASLERRIDAERQHAQHALTLKAGLMNDLLTGHVRVTPLLERHSAEVS